MNRKNRKLVLLGFLSMFAFTSCVSDFNENDITESINNSFGNIVRYENKENIDIVLDNNDTIRTLNTADLNKEDTKTGTRIIFSAKIIEKGNSKPYNLVKGDLTSIKNVPIEEYVLLSWVNEDQSRIDMIGNDPLVLNNITVSGKFLNVGFYIRQDNNSIKHKISFIVDDITPSKPGELNMIIRHNENGDIPSLPYSYIMSCDIKKYLLAAPVVSAGNASTRKLKVNMTYTPKVGETQVKSFDWDENVCGNLVN
ncbi:MAG: NigD-like C-terminal domain-containing protein [Rikenellaceae bacterium]